MEKYFIRYDDKNGNNKFESGEIVCTPGEGPVGPDNPEFPCPIDKVSSFQSQCLTEGGTWQQIGNIFSCSGVGWDFAGVGIDSNRDGWLAGDEPWECQTVTAEGLPSGTAVDCPWEGWDLY